MNQNVYALLAKEGFSQSNCFIETTASRQISFAEFDQLVGQISNTLDDQGVQPNDRVAVQVEKTPEALALCLAVLRIGAVYLPLNTAYTVHELLYFFNDAEPSLIVCDPSRLDDISKEAGDLNSKLLTLDALGEGSLMEFASQSSLSFQTCERNSGDLAAILYTSGTTGRSKGAMLTHENLFSNMMTLKDYWQFTKSDVLIHALPIYHTHGLFVASFVTLLARSKLLFFPKFDVNQIIEAIPSATSMMGVPTFYTRLLKSEKLTKELVSHMRLFVSGSAPLLAETHDAFKVLTGHAILERYGMTETGMNTSNPYVGERIAGTVGYPLPGIDVRITDTETGDILSANDVGMVEVKGPNVFKGYWRNEEKTREEFRQDGYFITGDLGKIDHDGYVHIVGRGKDLIISGGFNIYPKEVEDAINELDEVEESAVIGIPHPDFGEAVVAIVVPSLSNKLSEQMIADHLSNKIAKFKQPKRLLLVTELPRNTMGKVQKNVLRDAHRDLFTS